MLNLIDRYLDGFTMYKVVLYGLLVVAVLAICFGFVGLLPFKGYQLTLSLVLLFSACFGANFILSKLLRIPSNSESSYITGVILFFIMVPLENFSQLPTYLLAAVIAMGSKYLLSWHRKHIFNPAALSVFVLGLLGSPLVTWWVGSLMMLPAVAFLGFLLLRKLRRFQMFFAFFFTATVAITAVGLYQGYAPLDILSQLFISWPIVFFGTVMFTEPLTTPPTKKLRLWYGVIVGLLFGMQFHVGPIFSTPELALLIGNMYSYIVSSKEKLLLQLTERKQIAKDMYAFLFIPKGAFQFVPGQYMEWTLPHKDVDIRGNRRYFTIASSPTEETLTLGVKLVPNGSSFKKRLLTMDPKSYLLAGQLAGDFTLPKDTQKKLVFLAGGIGVTPFRSMIKYLVDMDQKRDIVQFFSNKTADEIVYKDIFDQAEKKLGIKTVYTLTGKEQFPKDWKGEKGRVDSAMIQKYVPDYKDRMYYISGPHTMVSGYQDLLHSMEIPSSHIIVDYFPGFV